MKTLTITPRRVTAWGATALAALAGFALGFGFGNQVSGPLLGTVTALNCSVMFMLLAGAVVDRLLGADAG